MRNKLAAGSLAVVVGFLIATNPVVVNAAGQITGKQIKNNSVTGKDIKDNSVKSGDVAGDSLIGGDILESSLGKVPSATLADSAAAVGSLAAAGVQDKASILFATIEPADAAPVIKKARGVVAVDQQNVGFFNVKFNRDVSGCTWQATYGKTGSGGVDAKFVTVRPPGPSHTGDPTYVGVVIFNDTGSQTDGDGFSISALCP